MWLVRASDTCREGEDFVSCLTYAIVLECSCLLEPLVGCFAELDHVVVESKFLLCSLVCVLHDLAELVDFVCRLDSVCNSCKNLSFSVNCSCCELYVHLDSSVLSVSWSCAVFGCAVACYAEVEGCTLKFLCIWVCCSLGYCFHEVWYAD